MKVASLSRLCLITASLILLTLIGCATKTPSSAVVQPPAATTTPDSAPVPPSERVPRITIDELLQKINSHADILIIDCRVDVEQQFTAGHIPGAVPVPLSKITEGQWLPLTDKEIIFYCS